MCVQCGQRQAARTAGAQVAWAATSHWAEVRCFSTDPQNNKKEPERVAGRGQFGSKVPSSLDLLLLLCLLAEAISVALSLSAGSQPSLSCKSCSSPVIQQPLSLPGPHCSLGTCVLSGNLGSFSPGTLKW